MADMVKHKKVYIQTGAAFLAFPHLDEPAEGDEGQKARYSAVLIFKINDKGECKTADEIRNAVDEVRKRAFPNATAAQLAKLTDPLKVGNDWDGESAEWREQIRDSYYINAKSDFPPDCRDRVMDEHGREYLKRDPKAFKPGNIVRANISVTGYTAKVNKGVTIYLNGIQWIDEGVPYDNAAKFDEDVSDIELPTF